MDASGASVDGPDFERVCEGFRGVIHAFKRWHWRDIEDNACDLRHNKFSLFDAICRYIARLYNGHDEHFPEDYTGCMLAIRLCRDIHIHGDGGF
jgi:hypothetical protein